MCSETLYLLEVLIFLIVSILQIVSSLGIGSRQTTLQLFLSLTNCDLVFDSRETVNHETWPSKSIPSIDLGLAP